VLRERAGLSQEALAERAGLGLSTVKALERDSRQRPRLQTLQRVADALDLTPSNRSRLMALAFEGGPSPPPSAAAPRPSAEPASLAPAHRAVRPELTQLTHIPHASTALIGRDAELAATRALLDPGHGSTRLLTLIGPAGVGKTRLALAVAADLANTFRDGTAFVDLGALHEPRLLPAQIARALAIREGGGRSARELLIESIRDAQLLLLLDNFEHLMSAAPLLAQLLGACPQLALLVTSRAALRLRDERRFVVPPLGTPAPGASLQ